MGSPLSKGLSVDTGEEHNTCSKAVDRSSPKPRTELSDATDVLHDDLRENSPEKLDNAIDVWRDELLLVKGVLGSGSFTRDGWVDKEASAWVPSISQMVSRSTGSEACGGVTKIKPLRLPGSGHELFRGRRTGGGSSSTVIGMLSMGDDSSCSSGKACSPPARSPNDSVHGVSGINMIGPSSQSDTDPPRLEKDLGA